MVKLAKNSSNFTTTVVKLARACTGRDLITRYVDYMVSTVVDHVIIELTTIKAVA